MAASLMGRPVSFVNADVALDGEPVVGSFTVDGLTFAVADDASVELVGASSGIQQALASQEGEAVADDEPSALEADAPTLALPESVAYAGTDYVLSSIAPYAFYLSGVASVVLPASITDVDDRAFRSSDVSSVDVAEGSGSFASFDGALYDADLTRLLLIPGGRTGAVRVPDTATSVPASAFSHCAGVGSIAVDEGSPAFSSWDGLLYDASGTTLLRVPAGATDITIRDGCTSIAAGAMEGCVSLATITAPASVASISPDVFANVPTVSLPAVALTEDTPQLTALVALNSVDDGLPEIEPSAICVLLQGDYDKGVWGTAGFLLAEDEGGVSSLAVEKADDGASEPAATLESRTTASAATCTLTIYSGNFGGYVGGGSYANANPLVVNNVTQFTVYGPTSAGRGSIQFYVGGTLYSVTATGREPATLAGWEVGDAGSVWGSDTYTGKTTTTVVAIWSDFTIGIVHNLNGGKKPYLALPQYRPNSVYELGTPSRTGYTFVGWYSNAALTGTAITSFVTPASGSVNIWAKWTPITYTINYSLNGGSVSGNPTSYNIETSSFTLKNPTRVGYKFTGWSGTGLTGSANTSVTVAKGSTGNRSYTAHWSSYNCTYTPGDLVTSTTVRSGWRNTSTGANTDTGTETLTGAKAYGGTDLYGTGEATIALYQGDKGVDGRLYYSYFTPVPKAGYSVTGWWRGSTSSLVPDWQSYWFTSDAAFGPVVTANPYTVEYWNKAGTTKLSSDTGFKYDTARNLAAKPTTGVNAGYTAVGWAASPNQSTATYAFSSSQKNLVTSGTKKLYLAETANPITLTWNSNGGSTVASTTQTYSPTAKVAPPANPSKAGYTFAGWWTAATGGVQVTSSTALPTANATYYAHWSLNPYAIAYELNGGTVSGNPTTYDVTTTTFTLKNPTRTGYVFAGWSGTGLSGDANMTVTIPQGSTGDRSYTAHWLPAISADIPLEVTAQVDLLGIEEQQEAAGYIESRCGEPLGVADVAFTPLSGAADLFGAANVADVALEVLATGSTAPDARFTLDASASQAPATPAAFRMASYGTRVPIAYRFAIPEDVLASIDPARFEQVTTPVCSVSYTVALA